MRIRGIALACAGALALAAAPTATAATGDILRQITGGGNDACGINVGLAFDGHELIMSCYFHNRLDFIDPATGAVTKTVTASGTNANGALAYDSGRDKLWMCSDTTQVFLVDPASGASTLQFNSDGCFDGLAYDGIDDTVWASQDASCTVHQYKTDGTLLQSKNACPLLNNQGNSGIAIGGENLYLANNAGGQVFQTDRTFADSALFYQTNQRLEDLECDTQTLAPKAAMWIQDAYDRILKAVEIPPALCVEGGGGSQPPVAALDATPKTGEWALATTFDASGSSDEDVETLGWRLDFGDGTADATGTGAPPAAIEHSYGDPGSYTAKLTLTDADDQTADATVAISVLKRATALAVEPAAARVVSPGTRVNLAPTATLTRAQGGTALAGKSVTFTAKNGAAICTATTNASGEAACEAIVSVPRAVLALGYTATFAGDAGYVSESGPGKILQVAGVGI